MPTVEHIAETVQRRIDNGGLPKVGTDLHLLLLLLVEIDRLRAELCMAHGVDQ